MTRTELKQQVDILVDRYEAIENRPRAQTHRNAIAVSVVELLVHWRRKNPTPVEAMVVPPVPVEWPRTRIRRKGWNGTCRGCKKQGEIGHLVAWDPNSGRPSRWQHVVCTAPFGRDEDRNGRLPLRGRSK